MEDFLNNYTDDEIMRFHKDDFYINSDNPMIQRTSVFFQ